MNNKEFSDVTFVVEGKHFYGHKIIISQLSDKFKAMFSGTTSKLAGGFAEAQQNVIYIDNISYYIFTQIMLYLYSGKFDFGPQVTKLLDLHKSEIEKATERSLQESD